ncbi:MAG: hypothetical protein BAA03_04510 [Caldibacillus debilis]|nr:MAG: hypothetical protein BAA03_04510 [Caldibacillus debilis]
MDNFLANSFPEYIRKELEQIQKLIFPLARKTSKYMFWTFPLIGISFLNIIYLLFFVPDGGRDYGLLFVYSVLGALGLALWKETRLNKKEIEKIGMQYMVERITKSRSVSEEVKTRYIRRIKEKPALAMENFVRFLQEEDRIERRKKLEQPEEDQPGD